MSFPLITFCLAAALLLQLVTSSVFHPIQYEIRARGTQCIYNVFKHGDFATFEVFIVAADEKGKPAAAIQMEGPIVSPKIGSLDPETGEREWDHNHDKINPDDRSVKKRKTNTMGASMQDNIENWPSFVSTHSKHFTEAGIVHKALFIDYSHSGENEDAIAARADHSRQQNEMREQRRRAQAEGGEVTGDENVDDVTYEEDQGIQHVIPDYIEPYEWTKPIKAAGWYRLCAQADNAITVEMDIRSSADLGGIDPETHHVYTHDERELLDEEERIMGLKNKGPSEEEIEAKQLAEELDKVLKEQVRDYDLDATRKLMSEVNKLVSQMQTKQTNVHKRIKGHEENARRNYRRIRRSGMIETVLYLVISLFQVYTVHQWLLSKNMLGR